MSLQVAESTIVDGNKKLQAALVDKHPHQIKFKRPNP